MTSPSVKPPAFNPQIFDNYLAPDQEFEPACEKLEQFLTSKSHPIPLKIEPLEAACQLMSCALRRLEGIGAGVRKRLDNIITLMVSRKKDEVCGDNNAARVYQWIAKACAQSDLIKKAIADLCIFSTPAGECTHIPTNVLRKALDVMAFAIKFKDQIQPRDQRSLVRLNDYVKSNEMYETFESNDDKLIQQGLVKCFKDYQPPKALPKIPKEDAPLISIPPPSDEAALALVTAGCPSVGGAAASPTAPKPKGQAQPPVRGKMVEDNFFLMPSRTVQEDEARYREQDEPRRVARLRQLTKICCIFKVSLENYGNCAYLFPYMWQNVPDVKKEVLDAFGQRFPVLAEELFFNTPKRPTIQEKELLYGILRGVWGFLVWYRGLNGLYKRVPGGPDLDAQMTKLAGNLSSARSLVRTQLVDTLKSILELVIPKESLLYGLGTLMISHKAVDMLETYLTPLNVCFLLDRMLNDPIDLNTGEGKTPPLSAFDMSDYKAFSGRLGELLNQIIDECYKLGEASGAAGAAAGMLQGAVAFINKIGVTDTNTDLGVLFQQAMASLYASECMMIPFLLLYHLLNKKEGDKLTPALRPFWDMPAAKTQEYVKGVQTVFLTKMYAMIMEQTKKKSATLAWGIDQMDSIKEFCDTLAGRLWQITQSQELMMMLVLHLLKGAKEGMVKGAQWKLVY